jgi:nitroreductase
VANSVFQKVRRRVAAWSLSGGRARSSLYFRFAGDEFNREVDAMSSGIREYEATAGSGRDLYFLRRHIHMLEKGLTMQPRRETFALDYIGRTVASYKLLVSADGVVRASSEEISWMRSVLADYFDATASAGNTKISRLRTDFLDFEASGDSAAPSAPRGPHAPSVDLPSVDIDDLSSLAQRRKSVRWFTDRPVDREIVDRAVLVGAEAPTACNRQPYRFEIFDDAESIAKLSAIPMGTRGFNHQIPGLIVVVGDLSAFFDPRDRHLIYVDSCLAAMGVLLGLEAQGVASCCINWPDIPEKEAAMARLLGLKDHERVIMLMAYGYAASESLVPYSAKKELTSVRNFNTL